MIGKLRKAAILDGYLLFLAATVVAAYFFPAKGSFVPVLNVLVYVAVSGLFFVHGVALSTRQVLSAMVDWRPQLMIFSATYFVFPIVASGLIMAVGGRIDREILSGFAFVSILPSTVQSSIAFTSIAKGDVAVALCGASVSNLAGVAVTPALASLLVVSPTGGAIGGDAFKDIALQILAPFIAGQLARPLLVDWITRHTFATTIFDRGSILLVVYSAFSAGSATGVWSKLGMTNLMWILGLDASLLGAILIFTTLCSRGLRFARGVEIPVVFCGSKKSLASGVPMANVLFSAHAVSVIIIPLMLFHQLQLFACAVLANRYARNAPAPASSIQLATLTRIDEQGLG